MQNVDVVLDPVIINKQAGKCNTEIYEEKRINPCSVFSRVGKKMGVF